MAGTTETLGGRGIIRFGSVVEEEINSLQLPTGFGVWNVNMGAASSPVSASKTVEAKTWQGELHSNAIRRLQRASPDGTLSGLGFLTIEYTPLDGAAAGLTHRATVAINDADVNIDNSSPLSVTTVTGPCISIAPVGITVV